MWMGPKKCKQTYVFDSTFRFHFFADNESIGFMTSVAKNVMENKKTKEKKTKQIKLNRNFEFYYQYDLFSSF